MCSPVIIFFSFHFIFFGSNFAFFLISSFYLSYSFPVTLALLPSHFSFLSFFFFRSLFSITSASLSYFCIPSLLFVVIVCFSFPLHLFSYFFLLSFLFLSSLFLVVSFYLFLFIPSPIIFHFFPSPYSFFSFSFFISSYRL